MGVQEVGKAPQSGVLQGVGRALQAGVLEVDRALQSGVQQGVCMSGTGVGSPRARIEVKWV